MGHFNSYEEIEAWQEALSLIREIREVCKRDNVRKDYPFVDQITRSARSVAANIAEGNDATSVAEFIQFLGYAKRSCSETGSHLYDALDETYISPEEFRRLIGKTKKLCRMLAKLMHYLRATIRPINQ